MPLAGGWLFYTHARLGGRDVSFDYCFPAFVTVQLTASLALYSQDTMLNGKLLTKCVVTW